MAEVSAWGLCLMQMLVDSFAGIDKSAPEPLYQQIKKTIEQKISSAEWAAGQKLPSENELVLALDVSRMTINRALRELTQLGLVNRIHGLGSFVAERPRHANLLELQDIAVEIEQSGECYSARVMVLEQRLADVETAAQMQIARGDAVFYLSAVHYRDEIPIQLENRYVNPHLMPEFLLQDFSQITSTAYLLQQFRPDEMEHIVRAVIADAHMQKQLHIEPSQPCLQLQRRTWSKHRLVTQVTLTYPGDRYELGAKYATDDYNPRP
ncbi:MAG: histidine utilization repressor [Gammaproteobacteria bacterium]|nr:histidine utilization repressor [Gammaproteobacteria bacterium]